MSLSAENIENQKVLPGASIAGNSRPDAWLAPEIIFDFVSFWQNQHSPAFDIYFVYPDELRNSQRIMVFRDFLIHRIASDGALNL